jgi:hypothetical protein
MTSRLTFYETLSFHILHSAHRVEVIADLMEESLIQILS